MIELSFGPVHRYWILVVQGCFGYLKTLNGALKKSVAYCNQIIARLFGFRPGKKQGEPGHPGRMVRAKLDTYGLLLEGSELADPELTSSSFGGSISSCCSTDTSFNEVPRGNYIPLKNLLWVEPVAVSASEVEVTFVKPSGTGGLVPATRVIQLQLDEIRDERDTSASSLTSILMAKAYPDSQPEKSVLVIINPHSGQGKANKIYYTHVEPILKAARYRIEVAKTQYSGHANEIAQNLELDKYDVVICASGDGIPHEVINGLNKRVDRADAFNKLLITQTPSGSGNAMSLSCLWTLDPAVATLEIIKGQVVRTDLMAVCSENNPVLLSFLSQTYGIIADADIGTEWMRAVGQIRFTLGVTQRVFSRTTYPCSVAFKRVTKNKDELAKYYKQHVNSASQAAARDITEDDFKLKFYSEGDTISERSGGSSSGVDVDWEWVDQRLTEDLTLLYAGKMPFVSADADFFPAALPNDGAIDVIMMDGRTKFLETVGALTSVDQGLHVWKKGVDHLKVEAFKLIPRIGANSTYISVDGENIPFEPIQVEILRGVLKTIMTDGCYKETGFSQKI